MCIIKLNENISNLYFVFQRQIETKIFNFIDLQLRNLWIRTHSNFQSYGQRTQTSLFDEILLASFILATRCQFHKQFTHNFFVQKWFEQLFSNYSLDLDFFWCKNISTKAARKMLMKLTPVLAQGLPHLLSPPSNLPKNFSLFLFSAFLFFSHSLLLWFLLYLCLYHSELCLTIFFIFHFLYFMFFEIYLSISSLYFLVFEILCPLCSLSIYFYSFLY